MSRRGAGPALLSAAAVALASCGPADAQPAGGGEVLPGHSRPTVEHDWPHPSTLTFEDSGFLPADPAGASIVTPAGVRAWVVPDDADPLVEITAAIPLGTHYEGGDEAGAAEVASRALGATLDERLGDLVANRRIGQERGVTTLSVEVLEEDWRPALEAVVRTLREPGLGAVRASRTGGGPSGGGAARPVAELTRLVARHPLAPPEAGRPVEAVVIRRTAARALTPSGVVLGIGGGVDRAAAQAALAELTAGWAPGAGAGESAATPPTLEAARPTPTPLHTIDVPGFMSWVAVGQAMAPVAPEDEAALAVMEEVVNIRLNIATRERRGLTNRAMLLLPPPGDGAGVAYVRTSGRSESIAPLIRYSVEELARIREPSGAPTAEELAQAKGGLVLGRWQGSLDGARRTAATYAAETVRRGSLDGLLGWPAAVGAVGAADVTRVARTYLDPGALTAVVVGQIDEVRAARHPRWPLGLDEVPELLRPE